MNLFPSIFHYSGGATYHWRALKNLNRLWEPHSRHTRDFLEEWKPVSPHLWIIGPSAGYSLPKEWLRQFKSVTAFEPDWLARKIFEARHSIKPKWIDQPFHFEDLRDGAIRVPEHTAVLFCNLLGQIDFKSDEEVACAQDELLKLAATQELASYHDILSGDHFRFEWESPMYGDSPVRDKFALEALDPYFTPMDPNAAELDLHVHSAHFLFQAPELFRYQYWEWQITEEQTQVIEGVYSIKQRP